MKRYQLQQKVSPQRGLKHGCKVAENDRLWQLCGAAACGGQQRQATVHVGVVNTVSATSLSA